MVGEMALLVECEVTVRAFHGRREEGRVLSVVTRRGLWGTAPIKKGVLSLHSFDDSVGVCRRIEELKSGR